MFVNCILQRKMKKKYISPVAEIVRLRIEGSILNDEQPIIIGSRGAKPEESFGKENNLFFDDDAFGDMWGDDEEPKNLWE